MATATASMSLQTSLLQLSGRLPAAVREDNALKQACSTQVRFMATHTCLCLCIR